jgi:hypothetical protein
MNFQFGARLYHPDPLVDRSILAQLGLVGGCHVELPFLLMTLIGTGGRSDYLHIISA